jgi:hypothetical protein
MPSFLESNCITSRGEHYVPGPSAWINRVLTVRRFLSSMWSLGRTWGLVEAAPMYRAWCAIARRQVRIRNSAIQLLFKTDARALKDAFVKWGMNAAASAREKLLDTGAHAAVVVAASGAGPDMGFHSFTSQLNLVLVAETTLFTQRFLQKLLTSN